MGVGAVSLARQVRGSRLIRERRCGRGYASAATDSASVNCGGIQEKNHDRDKAGSRFSLASDWKYAGGTAAEGRIAVYGRGSGEAGVLQSNRLLQRSHGVGND